MKKLLVAAAFAALLLVTLHGGDAEARRRHRYGLGALFLFDLTLYRYGYGRHHYPYGHGHNHRHGYGTYSPSIYLEDSDRWLLSEKTHHTLEKVRSGIKVRWVNPRTGIEGSVVARPAFKNAGGQYCREYVQVLRARGLISRGADTACRLPDGRWENAPGY